MSNEILSTEDINLMEVVYYFEFCIWLHENGWQNYVDNEIWICGKQTRHIKDLFKEFNKPL